MEDIVFNRFKTRIEDLGLTIDKIDEDELIYIEHNENTVKISLDNVRKSYNQDGNFDHLDSLIQSVHDYLMEIPIPTWDESKDNVFLSLYPSDADFQDNIHDPVTNDFHKYYVYYRDNQYIWISHDQLGTWEINEDTFKQHVDKNMNTLLNSSSIETMTTESGATLAYFVTEMAELKSALLFSKDLKEKVAPILGFPIYCVLPVRDFCYMFNEKDKDELIPLLGQAVLKEYQESGYEITTEIIKISDDGIEALGKYKE